MFKKFFLIVLFLTLTPAYAKQIGFESAEHVAIGDEVILFSPTGKATKKTFLTLPNGLELTYGQILAMGDFYGLIDQPISLGSTLQERKNRIKAAFNLLAYDPQANIEVPQILNVIADDQEALEEAFKRGEKPEAVYEKIGGDDNRRWNCITGGGCTGPWWLKKGRYLSLASIDYDHFSHFAWLAYEAGHTVAMELAVEANKKQNPTLLTQAYALNAFASHYLSDLFAAGHLRTPRFELAEKVTPHVIGSLLSNFMHNEDNQFGLLVKNAQQDQWTAYGDRYYFDKQSRSNNQFLKTTLQTSADEIYQSYLSGEIITSTQVKNQLGTVIDATQNIAPMFIVDPLTQKLLRRVDLANPYDYHWTDQWWGWSTLIILSRLHPLPAVMKQELAASHLTDIAKRMGVELNRH